MRSYIFSIFFQFEKHLMHLINKHKNIRKRRLKRKESIEGYLFLLPWIAGFVILYMGPMIASGFISFCRWGVFSAPRFTGIKNYERMFVDPVFWKSLRVTSVYVGASVPLQLSIAFVLALFLNKKGKSIIVFRTIYYFPVIIPTVCIAVLWSWIFSADYGILNYFISLLFNVPGPNWLGSEQWVLSAFIIMSLWGTGGPMLIFLAGLQGIPNYLYEVAEVDGASTFQKFWNVTVPLMTPVIFFNLIMGIIYSFQIFTSAYVMTGGGPNNASMFYVLYLYNNAFRWFRMGYASALAWIIFGIIAMLVFMQFKLAEKWVHYQALK